MRHRRGVRQLFVSSIQKPLPGVNTVLARDLVTKPLLEQKKRHLTCEFIYIISSFHMKRTKIELDGKLECRHEEATLATQYTFFFHAVLLPIWSEVLACD